MEEKFNSRERILMVASRLFFLQGYHATGLNQIIKESGAPKGSLYYYFPNGKEELALEAIIRTKENAKKKIKETLAKKTDPVEAIQLTIQEAAQHFLDVTNTEFIPIGFLGAEVSFVNEPLRQACQSALEELQNIFAERLIQSGFSEIKAAELGMVFSLMFDGAFVHSRTRQDIKPMLVFVEQIPSLLKR